ncbi:MAG: hypothetical protein CVU12_00160 [Bacteroidetes bacterium HGW-Bacteroidetes-7]|jgi:hypothetical protein|nr:MAG: hypothetical protein CVU12_00160 [Bacteroidetes bacterium HGW-Bacteroidetes-7]
MKKIYQLIIFSILLPLTSCDIIEEAITGSKLGGEQSAIGQVGVTVTSSSAQINGVSNFQATVTSLSGGVSTYTGSATVANSSIVSTLTNLPGVTVSGNTVTVTGVKFKSTTEGVESIYGFDPGILIKYSSSVGDEYDILGSSTKRVVTAKSTSDDFNWGGMMIKVLKVEENINRGGVKKITYFGNHKWGMVAVRFDFDDGSYSQFPIYNSANN